MKLSGASRPAGILDRAHSFAGGAPSGHRSTAACRAPASPLDKAPRRRSIAVAAATASQARHSSALVWSGDTSAKLHFGSTPAIRRRATSAVSPCLKRLQAAQRQPLPNGSQAKSDRTSSCVYVRRQTQQRRLALRCPS